MDLQNAYLQAVDRHQAGRLHEAEVLYRQILAAAPSHPDALHMLGVLAHEAGQSPAGVDLIRRAIEINPTAILYYGNLGNILAALGRRVEEIDAYRQIVTLRPDIPEGHYSLGLALSEAGRTDEAIAAYRQAIGLRPAYPEALNNLAGLLARAGQHVEAITLYRRALSNHPDAATQYNLGNILLETGDLSSAAHEFRQAIVLRPQFPEALASLSKTLLEAGMTDAAIDAAKAAIAISTHVPAAFINLAAGLVMKGEYEQAINFLRRALELTPGDAQTLHALGNAQRRAGRLDEAIAILVRGLEVEPQNVEIRFSLGFARLFNGDYAEGWPDYEARWLIKTINWARIPGMRWDGSELSGQKILLYADQGHGDLIQFARLIPEVRRRGGCTILRCQPSLHRLLENQCGIDEIISDDSTPADYSVQCAVGSLPAVLGVTVQNIPADVPYLKADPSLVERWCNRLAEERRLKVGIAWAGNPNQNDDRTRSTRLQEFLPLAKVPGVCFYSLQKGNAAAEAQTPPTGLEMIDWTAELSDFSDTAALIANLDLVISVDTAVAHLAGGIGKKVWVLLSFAPDWRWMLHRSDCPWYPTARLFRPPAPMQWGPMMEQVAKELSALTS